MDVEKRLVVTEDNHELVSRIYLPSSNQKGVVVIASAMGVPQVYYAPFATWLAENGYLVATFDYRGMGESLHGSLRGFEADLFDWAKDCSAVLNEIVKLAQDKPVNWIGHSFGGQVIPFVENIDRVSKIITVSSGSGYWRENAWPLKRRVWFLWYFAAPVLTSLFGYFPGKKLHMVGNLPKGVMTQWRTWCLNPNYCVGVEGAWVKDCYANIKIPIASIAFEDDELMSKRNIESLHSFYSGSSVTMTRLVPTEIGLPRVGHFGFFKTKFDESLWKQYLEAELAS